MFEDVFDNIMGFFPDEILGLPKVAFFGLLIGIIIACYEGIFTKFKDYRLDIKHRDEHIVFDKKYIVSGLVAVLVTFLTVDAVMSAGLLTGVTSFATAFAIGLAEGGQTIKYLNKRIDLYLKKQAKKLGASEEEAEKVAEAVEVVEVEKKNDPKKPATVSFEEL